MNNPALPTTAVRLACFAALALSLSGCGDGDRCPFPVFAPPATVTWPPAGADAEYPVVLRWAATAGDPLPDRYYEPYSFEALRDGGPIPVRAVRRTGARELTFTMSNLDAYLRDRSSLSVQLRFPDTMEYVPCRHPGMSDQYVVAVTFDFNVVARTATARFSEVDLVAGNCDVAAPGAGARRGVSAALLALIVVLGAHRRRRRV